MSPKAFPLLEILVWCGLLAMGIYAANDVDFSLAHATLFSDAGAIWESQTDAPLYNRFGLFLLSGLASVFSVSDFHNPSFYFLSNILTLIFSITGLLLLRTALGKSAGRWMVILLLSYTHLQCLMGFHLAVGVAIFSFGVAFWTIKRTIERPSAFSQIGLGMALATLCATSTLSWTLALGLLMFALIKTQTKKRLILPFIALVASVAVLLPEWWLNSTNDSESTRFFYLGESFYADVLPLSANYYWAFAFFPLPILALLLLGFVTKGSFNLKKHLSFLILPIISLGGLLFSSISEKSELAIFSVFGLLLLVVVAKFVSTFMEGKPLWWSLGTLAVVIGLSPSVRSTNPIYSSQPIIGLQDERSFLENETDFLLTEPYKAILKAQEETQDGQVLAHNYPTELPKTKGLNLKQLPFHRRLQAEYTKGVFTSLVFSPIQKRTPSFPPTNSVQTYSRNGHTHTVSMNQDTSGVMGLQALKFGQYGLAISKLKLARKLHPSHEIIPLLLGKTQFALASWEDALTSAEIALAYNPEYPDALCLKAEILLKQNLELDAFTLLEKCQELAPTYDRAFWVLGDHLLQKADYARAKPLLEKVVALNGPMASRSKQQLEFMSKISGDFETSSSFSQQIDFIVANSENPPRDLAAYRDILASWIDLDTNHAYLLQAHGMTNMYLQDFESAISSFDASLSSNPNLAQTRTFLAQAHVNAGAFYFEQDSFSQAIYHFNYALDYSPDDKQASMNAAITLTEMAKLARNENVDEAIAYLTQAAELANHAEAHLELGDIAKSRNDEQSAEIAFYRAHLINDKLRKPILELLKIYKSRGDKMKVDIYEKRLKIANE